LAAFAAPIRDPFQFSKQFRNANSRYRQETAALGYHGDTVVNSLCDILVCGLGFILARNLGFRRTLALFVVLEVVLAIWIRDNLSLNILMLIHPIDAIKQWQAAGH
jgi:hypothetical protein